jgi:hypothetical protein
MPAYRQYILDDSGRIAEPSQVVEFSDDDEAILSASNLLRAGTRVEIWRGPQRIFPRRAD